MAEMTAAEKTFFESGGEDDKALLSENKELAVEPKPIHEVTHETTVTDPAPKQEVTVKTAEDTAKAAKDAQAARNKLLADLGAVPLEALQEARLEAKTLKQQQQEMADWKKQVEPLLAQLKPKQTGNPYDPNVQPTEWSNYEWEAQKKEVADLKAGRERDEQNRVASERNNQVINWGINQEKEFIKSQPDYAEAANFARESRDRQLAVFYPDPNQRAQIINMEIAQIIAQSAEATMRGTPTNPAQKAYEFAIANGYKVKAKEEVNTEVIDKIQQGQKASGGLNGGAAPKGQKMTAEELARMPTNTPAQKKAWQKAWAEVYE